MKLTTTQLAMLMHGLNLAESERLELITMLLTCGSDPEGNAIAAVNRQINDIREIKPLLYKEYANDN